MVREFILVRAYVRLYCLPRKPLVKALPRVASPVRTIAPFHSEIDDDTSYKEERIFVFVTAVQMFDGPGPNRIESLRKSREKNDQPVLILRSWAFSCQWHPAMLERTVLYICVSSQILRRQETSGGGHHSILPVHWSPYQAHLHLWWRFFRADAS